MKAVTIIIVFFYLGIASGAQSLFQKTYGGINNEYGTCVKATTDGGYIIAGSTWSYGAGGEDIYLIKTNSTGEIQWTKTLGNNYADGGIESIQPTYDGGFILGSGTHNGNFWNRDLLLSKIDINGNVIWAKQYGDGGTKQEVGSFVQQAYDTGYIICGYISNFGASSPSDVYLVKTDPSGIILWAKSYGGADTDIGKSIQTISDGGFIVCGYTQSFGAGSTDIYLIRTNQTGDTLWTRTYGGTNQEIGYFASQTSDNGFVIIGSTNSFGVGMEDVLLIKTDSTGNVLWSKTYGGSFSDIGTYVISTNVGGYLITGSTESFGGAKADCFLLKINSVGDTLWTKTYGGTENDRGYSMHETMDREIIITGQTFSYGAGSQDLYLIKTDSLGNSGGCNQYNTTTITLNPSIVVGSPHTQVNTPLCISGTASIFVGSGGIVNNLISNAGVTIIANPNPFCPGITVNFTATPINGGTTPAYLWKVNGINTGTNSPNYSYFPQSGDSIWCIMTSTLSCVSGNPATSNKIIMVSAPVSVVNFTRCFDSITTINAKPITLKGGIPLGGTYSGVGVNSTTGVFNQSVAGIGTKTITYTYTNAALCSSSQTKNIIVQSSAAFTCGNSLTDIRDGQVYPTIHIGSQCWMAKDLNYGTMILASSHQRDNCIPEKYCYNDLATSCQLGTATYQWDELMLYDDTPGLQGLCPPGWHLPAEAEWNTLFSNWTNNAFAGAPLKYSGYSGFNALLSVVRHMNIQWDYQDLATFFWSSTPYGAYKAWAHGMNDYDPSVAAYPSSRTNAFSIRCLKD